MFCLPRAAAGAVLTLRNHTEAASGTDAPCARWRKQSVPGEPGTWVEYLMPLSKPALQRGTWHHASNGTFLAIL